MVSIDVNGDVLQKVVNKNLAKIKITEIIIFTLFNFKRQQTHILASCIIVICLANVQQTRIYYCNIRNCEIILFSRIVVEKNIFVKLKFATRTRYTYISNP